MLVGSACCIRRDRFDVNKDHWQRLAATRNPGCSVRPYPNWAGVNREGGRKLLRCRGPPACVLRCGFDRPKCGLSRAIAPGPDRDCGPGHSTSRTVRMIDLHLQRAPGMSQLLTRALPVYGLPRETPLTLLNRSENETWRAGDLILRLHRAGYHSTPRDRVGTCMAVRVAGPARAFGGAAGGWQPGPGDRDRRALHRRFRPHRRAGVAAGR